jgi:hypothetical protein
MSVRPRPASSPAGDLSARIDTIEESYEFLLAYAAQGVTDERASTSGGRARECLARLDAALTGLPALVRSVVSRSFADVLERDVDAAQAAVRLVLAQPSITSQLVDNLNASIHVRAMLTDLFLVDEVLKARRTATTDPDAPG